MEHILVRLEFSAGLLRNQSNEYFASIQYSNGSSAHIHALLEAHSSLFEQFLKAAERDHLAGRVLFAN